MSPDFRVSLDFPGAAFSDHLALVADLSAHLGVENGVVKHDTFLLTDIENRFDVGAGVIVLVAEKLRRRLVGRICDFDDLFLLRLARALALFLHQLLEAFRVDGQPAFARHQFGEIERETVGVVELERRTRPKLIVRSPSSRSDDGFPVDDAIATSSLRISDA